MTSEFSCTDILLITSYVLVFVFGVVGNALICYIFTYALHNEKRNKVTGLFKKMIFYLAVVDLISSIINPAFYIYWQATHARKWHFGTIGCIFIPSLTRIVTDMSLYIILVMTMNRCYVICCPLQRSCSERVIKGMIFGFFVVSVLSEIPAMIHQEVKREASCQVTNSSTMSYALPRIVYICSKDVIFVIVFLVAHCLTFRALYMAQHPVQSLGKRYSKYKLQSLFCLWY